MITPEFLIEHFQLEPLTIEGGMYRLHYRSDEHIHPDVLPERYTQAKATGNAIVYLHLASGHALGTSSVGRDHLQQPHTCSMMHRLRTDEIYHFYNGDPVTLLLLYPDGHSETHVLGQDYVHGHVPFFVVPRHVWQGSFLNDGGKWALLGCTLAPAYDDEDFELGVRELLCAQYPEAAELIRRLTPDDLEAHLATDPRKAGAIRLQTG
ncbi:MAG TPA: cupin domain-containing protein [Anaerolineae bacterium]|nr:cupin domain-containing protein [Anaerolineae bacterium]